MMRQKLQLTTLLIAPEHWKKLGALAQSLGTNRSAFVRTMIIQELRRADRQAAAAK